MVEIDERIDIGPVTLDAMHLHADGGDQVIEQVDQLQAVQLSIRTARIHKLPRNFNAPGRELQQPDPLSVYVAARFAKLRVGQCGRLFIEVVACAGRLLEPYEI